MSSTQFHNHCPNHIHLTHICQCNHIQTNNRSNNNLNFGIQMNNKLCQCAQTKGTEIGRQSVIDGLLKYNTGLTRYLSKYYPQQNKNNNNNGYGNQYQGNNKRVEDRESSGGGNNGRYVSIVEENNLNFQAPGSNLPKKQQEKQQLKGPQVMQVGLQTSPRNDNSKKNKRGSHGNQGEKNKGNNNGKKNQNLSDNQKKIEEYYKNLRYSSRYLPDTGFRKHFNRQCFENYGRENTNGVADGILYGNYLKTFNINPHSGANLPQSKQTYEHSLIAAQTNKLADYDYIQTKSPKGKSKHQNRQNMTNRDQEYNMQEIIEQNKKYHDQQDKYNHIKLVKKDRQQEMGQADIRGRNIQKNYIVKYNQRQRVRNIDREGQSRRQIQRAVVQQQQQDENYRQNYNNEYQRLSPKHNAPSPKHNTQIRNSMNYQNQNYQRRQPQPQHQTRLPPQKPPRQYQIYNPPQILQRNQQNKQFQYSGCPHYQCFQSPQFYQLFKQYILNQGFNNPQLIQSINKSRKHPQCQICKERRYTKCCCT